MENLIEAVRDVLSGMGVNHMSVANDSIRFFSAVTENDDKRAADYHLTCLVVKIAGENTALVSVSLEPDSEKNSYVFFEHLNDLGVLFALSAPPTRGVTMGLGPNSHKLEDLSCVFPMCVAYVDTETTFTAVFAVVQALKRACTTFSHMFSSIMDIVDGKLTGKEAFYATVETAKKAGARMLNLTEEPGDKIIRQQDPADEKPEDPVTPFGPGYFGPAGN